MTLTKLTIAALLALAAGCATDPGAGDEEEIDVAGDDGDDGKSDAWNQANNPAFVDGTFVYDIDQLPISGAARTAPWPGDYWPATDDSINVRWDGATTKSPAEKYAAAFAKPGLPDAITNKLGAFGQDGASCMKDKDCDDDATCSRPRDVASTEPGQCVPGWYGICNGWTGAAISQPAPKKSVVRGGVTFYPGDLEALMSVVYYYAVPTKYLGERCDVSGPGVDGNGRPRDGTCRDLNPGSLFVVASNFLGLRKQAFAEDRVGNDEVWNQPVLGFEITNAVGGKLKEVNESDATKLVTGKAGAYTFNTKAKRFFDVAMSLHYVTESAPAKKSHVDDVADFTQTDKYHFVLEADANGQVIGGEYIGDSKTEHPDFVWWITGKPYGFLPGGMTYAVVKEMFDESAGVTAIPVDTTLFTDQAVASASVYATIGVGPNQKLTVTMTGTGNADLYVRLGKKPTTTTYDKVSKGSTSKESVTLTAGDAGGTYYVRVKPVKSSTVTVTATVE